MGILLLKELEDLWVIERPKSAENYDKLDKVGNFCDINQY